MSNSDFRALKLGAKGAAVTVLQKAINSRARTRNERGWLLVVDGDLGPKTQASAHHFAYELGAADNTLKAIANGTITPGAQNLLVHPAQQTKEQHARAMARRKRQQELSKGRAGALRWAHQQVGITEDPPGSNRGPQVSQWQTNLAAWLVGEPWCGVFAANALIRAGVKGVTWRLASVSNIEDDARACHAPFLEWTLDRSQVKQGDLVVLFGRGVHVGLVDKIDAGGIHTVEGNTSPAPGSGSEFNGGCVAARYRAFSDVHGFAIVRF